MNIPKDQLRLIYILVILCIVGMCAGCSPYVVDLVNTNESMYGKPLFHVKLSDGTVMEYMYKEEIRECIRTGNWTYNEDLGITVK
jgi:hypothetical protein